MKLKFSRKLRILTFSLIATLSVVLCLYLYGTKDARQFEQLSRDLLYTELSGNTINLHYTLAYPENYGLSADPILPSSFTDGDTRAQVTEWQRRLSRIDPQKLDPQDRYAYLLFDRFLALTLEGADFTYYTDPLSPSSGMVSGLPVLLADYTFRTKKDVEDYLGILEQTGTYFDALIRYEQEKSSAGLFMSDTSADNVIEQCDSIMDPVLLSEGSHFLQQTFTERLNGLVSDEIITEKEKQQYIHKNDLLLTTVMAPAYERVGDAFLVLKGTGVNPYGLFYYPEGKEYYTYLLAQTTGSSRSIPEIQRFLEKDYQENFHALRDLVRDHPGLLKVSSEDFSLTSAGSSDTLYELSNAILADLQKQMKPDFPKLTCISENKNGREEKAESKPIACQFKMVSPSMEAYSSPAYYLTPPIDDLQHNTIYLNEPNITDDLTLYTTLAHEGYPGHLYQTVYSQSFLNQQNASSIRSLLHYGGFTEGWAVYVENLSYDYAAQLTKNEETAAYIEACRLNRNLHLCLYSYMDIAIHYDGATPEQIGRFLENLGLGRHANAKTIYEYLVEEPCNYLKYYLGYLEFLSLKQQAEELWGTDYSDYRFHKFVLETGPSDFRSLGEQLEKQYLGKQS
jgi:uncharacterized protein (DUF885 family)